MVPVKAAGSMISWVVAVGNLVLITYEAEGAAARLVTGVDTNSPAPHVKAFSARSQTTTSSFFAYGTSFSGGVRVASGDVNGDGATDLITATGPGSAPHVKVFSGRDSTELASFFAYDPAFTGGVFVAAGDVNGDGRADIITGVDAGAGPHVKVFNGTSSEVLSSFFAFDAGFQGGVRVATGDLNGDGFADIIVATGPGGGPHIKVFDGSNQSQIASFFAYAPTFTGGVYVASGDVNGDGIADIITGSGPGGGPHVKVFDGATGTELASFFAYGTGFSGGVRVAAGDVDGDGIAELMVGPGPGMLSTIRVLDALGQQELAAFLAYGTAYEEGVFVAIAPVVRPVLRVTTSRLGNLLVSWPVGEIGTLEFNGDPGNPRAWQPETTEPVETGDRFQVELAIGADPGFYRLNCDEEAIPPDPM
jgi:hypothetical protein